MEKRLDILMVASECGKVAKAGGLGDVVFDLSNNLKKLDYNVKIIIPYYEVINLDAFFLKEFKLEFGRINYKFYLYKTQVDNLDIYLIKSQNFFSGETGGIYVDSDRYSRGPFEDDAKRFAFFSKCVCELLIGFEDFKNVNVLHNHDWHTGVIPVLLKLCSKYRSVSDRLKTVFTIHNLDYQGVRPFYDTQYNELTSFETWFPDLYEIIVKDKIFSKIKSPKIFYPCFNPMRAGINLSDFVNTVSPSYAGEITQKDNLKKNFFGGRGLERDLQKLYKKGNLFGILNGIDYDEHNPANLIPPFNFENENWSSNKLFHKKEFIENFIVHIEKIYERQKDKFINWETISEKIKNYKNTNYIDKPLFVSVSRAVTQKLGILIEKVGKSLLADEIAKSNIFLIIIGTGELQEKLETLNRYDNIFYIAAFDRVFADKLYAAGDFFLMPSYFEPCGISQMIALRYGTIPIANEIGGLKDTIRDKKDGFLFTARSKEGIKKSFIETFKESVKIYRDKNKFNDMQICALKQKFSWENSVTEYLKIYGRP